MKAIIVNKTCLNCLNSFLGYSYSRGRLTSAVSSTAVQFVTIITHTTEHPRKILACSKHTDVLEITFINVCVKDNRERQC